MLYDKLFLEVLLFSFDQVTAIIVKMISANNLLVDENSDWGKQEKILTAPCRPAAPFFPFLRFNQYLMQIKQLKLN